MIFGVVSDIIEVYYNRWEAAYLREFFHADTTIYPKRLKMVIIALLMPLAAVCVFCAANIVFNLRADGDKSLAELMLRIIAGCVAIGMTACFAGAYIVEKKQRRHARFTYFDILPKGMIYSRYAGEHYLYGERTIYRRLYYIPFSGLTEIKRDPKTAPTAITFTGEIREYFFPSEQLGYHIDEDGELKFDNLELDFRFYKPLDRLRIRYDLGNTKQLERSAQHYLELFRNAPKKREFNIAEHIHQRSKKPLKTSNPLLEAPSFDRKW